MIYFMQLQISFKNLNPGDIIETVVYSMMGLIIFGLSIRIMDVVTPFSLRKELEEDQNTALGIVMGAVIPGIAIILSASPRN